MSLRALLLSLGGLATVPAAAIVFLSVRLWGRPSPPEAELELLKFAIEIFVVVVVATTARLLLAEYQDQVQRRRAQQKHHEEAQRLARRTVLRKATETYHATKRIRRMMRVQARPQGSNAARSIDWVSYDRGLRRINDLQSQLERLPEELTGAGLGEAAQLEQLLARMERYLHEIIREWEQATESVDERLSLTERPKLADFLEQAEASAFIPAFSQPFHRLEDLLESKLGAGLIPLATTPPAAPPAVPAGAR